MNRLPAYTDSCHGIVADALDVCGKPATCIVDDPNHGWWPACVWHAHRYGGGRMVTLDQIVAAARFPVDTVLAGAFADDYHARWADRHDDAGRDE